MIEIRLATVTDIPHIQSVAEKTWPKTFGEILSEQQIKYMLNWMYSEAMLKKQLVEENHIFILAIDSESDEVVGFAGIQHGLKNGLTKIHKLYINPNIQGKGVGKSLIQTIALLACKESAKGLFLNVNKYNMQAIEFYKYIGFTITEDQVIDIGQGYIMDDFVMEMPLVC